MIAYIISTYDNEYGAAMMGVFTSLEEAEAARAKLYDLVTNEDDGELKWKHPSGTLGIREVSLYTSVGEIPEDDRDFADYNYWYGPDDDEVFEEKRAALFARREHNREQERILQKALVEPPKGPVVPLPEEFRRTKPNFEEVRAELGY